MHAIFHGKSSKTTGNVHEIIIKKKTTGNTQHMIMNVYNKYFEKLVVLMWIKVVNE